MNLTEHEASKSVAWSAASSQAATAKARVTRPVAESGNASGDVVESKQIMSPSFKARLQPFVAVCSESNMERPSRKFQTDPLKSSTTNCRAEFFAKAVEIDNPIAAIVSETQKNAGSFNRTKTHFESSFFMTDLFIAPFVSPCQHRSGPLPKRLFLGRTARIKSAIPARSRSRAGFRFGGAARAAFRLRVEAGDQSREC